MTDQRQSTQRGERGHEVDLSKRIPVGEQVGTCEFLMDENTLCGRPVYARSLKGRLPTYCEQVVDGVQHTAKRAAIQRTKYGYTAETAPKAPPFSPGQPVASATTEEGSFVSTPASPISSELATSASQSPDISSVSSERRGVASVTPLREVPAPVETTVPEEEVAEPYPVSMGIERAAELTGELKNIGNLFAQAMKTIVPGIEAALLAAGAAGAAEREIVMVKEEADNAIAHANRLSREAQERAEMAEARAREHAEQRISMAAERDEAYRERDHAVAEAEAAKAGAQEATADAERRISENKSQASSEVREAEKAQRRAEGEAEALRSEVAGLRAQIGELNERIAANEEQHRRELRETGDYWQAVARQAAGLTKHTPSQEPSPTAEPPNPPSRTQGSKD